MAANTCYTQSAGTGDVQWISTSVSDAYWWTAVSCNGGVLSSSSSSSSSVSTSSSGTTATLVQTQNSLSWSVQHGELQIIVVNAGMVNVKVLDLMGHIESVPVNSSLTAGSHTVMLGQLKQGMHIVRVQTGRGISSRTITIR